MSEHCDSLNRDMANVVLLVARVEAGNGCGCTIHFPSFSFFAITLRGSFQRGKRLAHFAAKLLVPFYDFIELIGVFSVRGS